MKVLGIIPARGGSKRLPRKNIADLGGKPLLQWTLDAAIESKLFDEGWLWVSSEDEEIGAVAGAYWWRRDNLIAQDTTPTLPVILDVFGHQPADVVIVLQPTSPFRTATDIKEAFDIYIKTKADTVISTTENESDVAFEEGWAGRLRVLSRTVKPNGAIYLLKDRVLKENISWYDGPGVYGYKMPKERSLDIDNGTDLEIARHLVSTGRLNGNGYVSEDK
jgi:CMP-N,N'-diacetyllegionaminic acid synthase